MREAPEAFRSAILAALGYAPDVIEPGRFVRFPTCDRRGDDAGWCRMFDDLRGGVYGCHRQQVSAVWCATDRATMTHAQRVVFARQVMRATAEREAAQRAKWEANAQCNARTWAESVPLVPGDPCTQYLKRRGFGGVWPLPEVLRLHRALPYWHDGERAGSFPAMVAPITAADGRVVALHRTYLTRDGRKADVPQAKKLTRAAGPLTGASIRLYGPARGCIGIAEGIETALAAWCGSGVPTVASSCAALMAAWHWPAGVQRLVIFADADKAGREAADTLRVRALAAGLRAEVLTPEGEGADWCDVWAARGVCA